MEKIKLDKLILLLQKERDERGNLCVATEDGFLLGVKTSYVDDDGCEVHVNQATTLFLDIRCDV